MTLSVLRRATSLAAAASLLSAGIAVADTVQADGDLVTAGAQGSVDLGHAAPGATLTVPLAFQLTCASADHVADGAVVSLEPLGGTAPLDGAISSTGGSVGPIQGWPADLVACADPAQVATVGTPAQVTLTAPTTAGGPYTYSLLYATSVSDGDAAAVPAFVGMSFTLSVGTNTPPTLRLPADLAVEGDTTGGAVVTYAVSASDAEDVPAPTPACRPASGSLFGLGTTVVTCSVTDSGGLADSGSFRVTVTDTTPPILAGVPSGIRVDTTSPAGTAVAWPAPTASDVVDPDPTVSCAPASGSTFPVGTTIVTCSAADHSGNERSVAFPVSVDLYAAAFDAPIGPSDVVDANGSRSVPVKVRLWKDGVEQSAGRAALSIAPCDGGPVVAGPVLAWQSGRWTGKLDTAGLAGCRQVSVTLDGAAAGFFLLRQSSATSPAGASTR